jgi:hypothetical protein
MAGVWCLVFITRKQNLFGKFEVSLMVKLMIFERKYNNFTKIYTKNKYLVENRDFEPFI